MNKKILNRLAMALLCGAALMLTSSCEGPAGPTGEDANESCKTCHNPDVVDAIQYQYEISKHSRGEAAFEETGNATCAPCHEATGFKYVCKNAVNASFIKNETTGKYSNGYVATAATAYGEFKCNTCHSNLHKAYDTTDFYPLTTVAPVAMTMWAGAKTIDLKAGGGKSNLCVKCHQPRPLTTSSTLSDGNVLDYASFLTAPNAVFYDSAVGNAAPNKLIPGYRTHVHYGGVGAIYAGMGGIEFVGTAKYENSVHTTTASCQDCHMAAISGGAGGHTFKSKGNFNGCNVSGCHSIAPLDASSAKFKDTRSAVKKQLDDLAKKFVFNGLSLLHSETDAEANLWVGLTTNNYDGYLNIYDPSTNPNGVFRNAAPSSSWTTAQKSTNSALPKIPKLLNVQIGALINFQLCLRDYSLGVHNTLYTKALLTNTIEALTAAGY